MVWEDMRPDSVNFGLGEMMGCFYAPEGPERLSLHRLHFVIMGLLDHSTFKELLLRAAGESMIVERSRG